MKSILLSAFAALAGGIALCSAANAAIISDGEFNNPWGNGYNTSSNGEFSMYSTDGQFAGSSFGGWTVISGTVDLIGSLWQAPVAGGGSVDMDGASPGAISQTFTTSSGWYELSFLLSGNPVTGPLVKTLDVKIDGIDEIFTYDISKEKNTYASMDYIAESLLFYSDGGPTTLTFTSLDTNSAGGAVIGDVSVSPVPAPASLPLFGAALVGLGGFSTMKRRKAA